MRSSTSILLSLLLLSACARGSKDFAVTITSGAEIQTRLVAAKRLGPEERENVYKRLLEVLDTRFSTQEGVDALSILAEIGDDRIADILASGRYRDQKRRDEGQVNSMADDVIETIRAKKTKTPNQTTTANDLHTD